jgi:hypothetical protein
MNLERRWFTDLAQNYREQVVSMHVFSDGSPVTGHQLQGMVLQICHLWAPFVTTLVMPGVMLHHSGTSHASKLFAFMWSLYLMVGASLPTLEWVLTMIRSITTDMGTELGLTDCPSILAAFMLWLGGAPVLTLKAAIDNSTRMFRRALKIPGWSHLFGNAMSYASKCIDIWPKLLDAIRALCRFFRNGSWRDDIIKQLAVVYAEAGRMLKNFSARIAKWRYETIFQAMKQLLGLRELCQRHLRNLNGMFPTFADREFLQQAAAAINWDDLWVFMACMFRSVMDHLEHARRWGLVCPCCSELRRVASEAGKKGPINCVNNSRRLAEARTFYYILVQQLARDGRNLRLVNFENLPWAMEQITLSMRKTSTWLDNKGTWLKRTPWLMSEANNPEQAKEIRRQLHNAPADKLTPLELEYRDDYDADLKVARKSLTIIML